MTFEILSSFMNWFSTASGTIQMESLQQAISVMIHSSLFSENIPMNFRSGVPSTDEFYRGHSYLLIIDLERDSTKSSTSLKVFHVYSPNLTPWFPALNPYEIYSLTPRNLLSGKHHTVFLKHFQIVSAP